MTPKRTAPKTSPPQRDSHRPAAPTSRTCRLAGVLPNTAVVAVVVAVVAIFSVVVTLAVRNSSPQASSGAPVVAAGYGQVLRDSSHRLSTAPDAKVTFVEFLDFECEACRAAYPVVEQLRQQYAGRVIFALRYFPIESHVNAMRASRAVEAAAQQGQLEAMYQKMYTTQQQWGEQQVPADATFRGFASDLGLDLVAWDAAYDDQATLDRINLDVADGRALGVEGTPTFFVNGQRIQPRSVDDLYGALDAALAE